MKEKLKQISLSAIDELQKAVSLEDIESLRIKYLGKKGELTSILKLMGGLSASERPAMGQMANEIRGKIENFIADLSVKLKAKAEAEALSAEKIDVTMPGKHADIGSLHPLTIIENKLIDKNVYFVLMNV